MIRSFNNFTHDKRERVKIRGVGALIMECIVARCLSSSLDLKVVATGSYEAYFKFGFVPENILARNMTLMSPMSLHMKMSEEGWTNWKKRIFDSNLKHDQVLVRGNRIDLLDDMLEEFFPPVRIRNKIFSYM